MEVRVVLLINMHLMMMFMLSEKPLLVPLSRNLILFPHDIAKDGKNFFDGSRYEIVVLTHQVLGAIHLKILNQLFIISSFECFSDKD